MLFFPASLYLTLLQQGVADLGMASLLILDEVHQATKEHPMNSILKDFHWKLSSDAAPKVTDAHGTDASVSGPTVMHEPTCCRDPCLVVIPQASSP